MGVATSEDALKYIDTALSYLMLILTQRDIHCDDYSKLAVTHILLTSGL